MRTAATLAAVFVLAALSACKPAPAADPQLVAQWMRTSLAFVRAERLGPPVASRISAYASIALYEGYAAGGGTSLRSLAGQVNGLERLPQHPEGGPLDGAVVAATAERVVLDSLFRDGFASTRRTIDSLSAAQIAARTAAGVADAQRDRSVKHGEALGRAILAWAATDSFFATRGRPWSAPATPGSWQNTATPDQYVPLMLSAESDIVKPENPNAALELDRVAERWVFTNRPKAGGATTLPAFNPTKPTEPYWGELRPFVLETGDACAPPPPPTYSEQPGSPFYAMAEAFYDSVKTLTPAQKEIALFWGDNPVATGTPGFHWISLANQMVARRSLGAEQAAELYLLTSVSIADAFIGCWREKYRSMVVRPVATTRKLFDPAYQTVIPTPPFPEYTSGHSVQSGAAVHVLTALLGDTIAFVDSTQVDIGWAPRAFKNFTAARDEVSVSRVYAGVHFWPAVKDGLAQGECIGTKVMTRIQTRRAK
ncbi:MAG: vanadium-dependent haloperoxidase [Gemmatimonadaceae bacterium]|nr:vanadium-dependent haloperoxidase [Gemmatimonadaceae bacterium]